MRLPPDPAPPPSRAPARRRGLWILVALGVVLIAIVLLEAFAGIYTNFLWFHYAGVGEVWRTVTGTKLALGAVFVVVAFAACFVNLLLVEIIAPRALFMASDTELVRRYQAVIGPHAVLFRTAVSAVVGLFLGVGASGQWQHWLLFEHAVSFGRSDPLFGVDDSLFVFRLPFLSFLVGWLLVTLLVVFLLSAAGHFLNGAIRGRGTPRIEPRALAHLSLVLGAMALVRAWGYYFVDRYRLDLSVNGVVQGAGYTDVHVRLPAATLLAVVALAAFVMLVFNAYQRSTVLPAVAVGLWVLLAFVLGVLYPAILQAFRVAPSQQALERTSVAHNIAATQYAMGLGPMVTTRQFPASQDLTADVLERYRATLGDAQLWDPASTETTFQQLQAKSPYFTISDVNLDRYRLHGRLTPVIVGVRTVNAQRLAGQSWEAVHLEYTHGEGALLAPANAASASGEPHFVLGGLPPHASGGAPALTEPAVYFAPGMSTYAIVDTTQPEAGGSRPNAGPSHYGGSGGVPIGTAMNRIAFALELKDFNLLTSGAITGSSRLITEPGVRERVQKAFPFLRIDAHPSAVIDHGHIDWVVDGYTTSDTFPDAQSTPSGVLAAGSPLNGGFNYVRDAVKIVVNAYSGTMHAYVIARNDPVIRSWERVFPQLFSPLSAMDATLRAHLRYPADLLSVQALMYSRYHVSDPNTFYSGAGAWQPATLPAVSGTSGTSGATRPAGAGGVGIVQPVYELLQLPGDKAPTFETVEALVPYSASGTSESLSALLFASSAPDAYGRLEALITPRRNVAGPAMAATTILRSDAVTRAMARLSAGGATVTLGAVQTVPLADSLLYIDPLYVSGASGNFPQLGDVIVVYGSRLSVKPTLARALDAVFGLDVPPEATGGTARAFSTRVRSLLQEAASDFAAAKKALDAHDLGTYQRDVAKAAAAVASAQKLLAGSSAASPSRPTTNSAPAKDSVALPVIPAAVRRAPTNIRAPRSTPARAGGVVEEPAAPMAGVPAAGSTGGSMTAKPAPSAPGARKARAGSARAGIRSASGSAGRVTRTTTPSTQRAVTGSALGTHASLERR